MQKSSQKGKDLGGYSYARELLSKEDVRDMLENLELPKKHSLRHVVVHTECPIDDIFTAIESRTSQLRLELSYLISPVASHMALNFKHACQQMNALINRNRG